MRSDNTSAATHEMKRSRGRALNDNYAALLDHYGLRTTRINRGKSHENGVAEHAHYRLKDAVDQALILRGSRDFHTADDYADFVQEMVTKRNRLVRGKLEQEMACLRPLPPAPMPEYANYQSKVRRWSTIQVAGRSYSVPSRLIGKVVQIRLYSGHLEVYYKGHFVELMERVRGDGEVNVNYRHVINSLVRKPGSLRPVPVSGAAVSHHALPARLRRAQAVARGSRRRGVRPGPASGGADHGSQCGQRAVPASGDRSALRLRRGAGTGRAQGARGSGAGADRQAGPEDLRWHQRHACRTASASCAENSSCPPWASSRWPVSPRLATATPCPPSWMCWSRRLRIVATGASAGCAPRPGRRQARPSHRLDNYDFLLMEDLGYLLQGAEDPEVLFSLIAER